MINIIGIIMLTLAAIVVLMALNIAFGMLLIYFNHKCPYCGKRMKYQYKRKNTEGEVECFVYHCNHCGAYDNVAIKELAQELHNTHEN